jgi:hypothetical protein
MNWYSAHNICYWVFRDGIQDSFPIWESVHLISAQTLTEAKLKAEQYGKNEELGPELSTSTVDGRPAYLKYAGVRGLSKIDCPDIGPREGSFLFGFGVTSRSSQDVGALLHGKEVDVTLSDVHFEVTNVHQTQQQNSDAAMDWFTAHNLMVAEAPHTHLANSIYLETGILIAASDPEADLEAMAHEQGAIWQDKLSVEVLGKLTQLRFVGVRKIISCRSRAYAECTGINRLEDGTEVSFSMYSVPAEELLDALLVGRLPIDVTYADE